MSSPFLIRVKTAIVEEFDIDLLCAWAHGTAPNLSPRKSVDRHLNWRDAGYQVNMPWRFRKVAEQALNGATDLPQRLQPIARCIVLKSVQWAVDCKNELPTAAEFREQIVEDTIVVTTGLAGTPPTGQITQRRNKARADRGFQGSHRRRSGPSRLELLHEHPPKLVVTSLAVPWRARALSPMADPGAVRGPQPHSGSPRPAPDGQGAS